MLNNQLVKLESQLANSLEDVELAKQERDNLDNA